MKVFEEWCNVTLLGAGCHRRCRQLRPTAYPNPEWLHVLRLNPNPTSPKSALHQIYPSTASENSGSVPLKLGCITERHVALQHKWGVYTSADSSQTPPSCLCEERKIE